MLSIRDKANIKISNQNIQKALTYVSLGFRRSKPNITPYKIRSFKKERAERGQKSSLESKIILFLFGNNNKI